MTDLPPGDPFHTIEVPAPVKLHAYVQMKDLNDGVKFATRLCLDRVRRENFNPRKGTMTITFDDDGVAARWEPIVGIRLPE